MWKGQDTSGLNKLRAVKQASQTHFPAFSSNFWKPSSCNKIWLFVRLCIKHSWLHCIFLIIITFASNPPRPPPGSIPISPFKALSSCFSEDDTICGGGGGYGGLTAPNGQLKLGPRSAAYMASRLILNEKNISATTTALQGALIKCPDAS